MEELLRYLVILTSNFPSAAEIVQALQDYGICSNRNMRELMEKARSIQTVTREKHLLFKVTVGRYYTVQNFTQSRGKS